MSPHAPVPDPSCPTDAPLLLPEEPPPVGIRNAGGRSPFLLLCDHAGNRVPARLATLGLTRAELDRHIDIGALPVSEALSDRLDAPLVFQPYSRLVIDCNRQPHAADSIPTISDGTVVPGNQGLDETARAVRRRDILAPYHRAIDAAIEARRAAGRPTVIGAIHSFTPSLRARPAARPWHIAVIYGANPRFSERVAAMLRLLPDTVVGVNEPYVVSMENDYSIPLHAEARGLDYVEIEIRQDLIADAAGAALWAGRLAEAMLRALDGFAPAAAGAGVAHG